MSKTELNSYQCPYCFREFSLHSETIESFIYDPSATPSFDYMRGQFEMVLFNEKEPTTFTINGPRKTTGIKLHILRCPNKSCSNISIFLNSYGKGYPFYSGRVIPEKIITTIPEFVPDSIQKDINEAELIVDLSPKASATLSRRALQGMIRDFYKISDKRTLFDEIEAICDKIDSEEYEALTSLRSIGNIGAHPEKNEDINILLEIDQNEASQLILLVHHFIDSWYVKRDKTSKLLNDVSSLKDKKEKIKNSQ